MNHPSQIPILVAWSSACRHCFERWCKVRAARWRKSFPEGSASERLISSSGPAPTWFLLYLYVCFLAAMRCVVFPPLLSLIMSQTQYNQPAIDYKTSKTYEAKQRLPTKLFLWGISQSNNKKKVMNNAMDPRTKRMWSRVTVAHNGQVATKYFLTVTIGFHSTSNPLVEGALFKNLNI